MELRDYTPDEIEALVNEIELGAMRRDAGIDPSIPQFDAPREAPSLRSSNTKLGDFVGSNVNPLAGEITSGAERAINSLPDVAYHASGLGMVEHGAKNVSEGMNEGSVSRVAGGLGEVGLAAMPLSGRALGAAYRTIPRALGTGAAYGASPLVAAGVLSPEDAQAAEEGSVFDLPEKDTLSYVAPVVASALAAGVAKGAGKNYALNQKQAAVDLDRILANRERGQIVKDDFPIPNFKTKIEHELREKEPVKYHNKDNDNLLREKVSFDEAGDQNLEDLWKIGALFGGLSGGGTDIAVNGFDLSSNIPAALWNGALGSFMPAFSNRSSKNIKTDIERYDPNPDKKPFIPNGPSDQLRLGRSPIAEAHPIETRTAIERRLKKGEAVKDLAEEYGIHQSNLYRWKRKLNNRAKIKKADDKKKTTDRE
ncbi:MAG: hypothetical protein DHS20C07_19300 [Methyloligella sp.]|nr:MAG: hypothetical protein DHS20C07_19300 [Methyloligella sp.]